MSSPFLRLPSSPTSERQVARIWNTLALSSSVSPLSWYLPCTLSTGRARPSVSDRPLLSDWPTLVLRTPTRVVAAVLQLTPCAEVSLYQSLCFQYPILIQIQPLPHLVPLLDLTPTGDTASRTASLARAELLLVVLPEAPLLLVVASLLLPVVASLLPMLQENKSSVCVRNEVYTVMG